MAEDVDLELLRLVLGRAPACVVWSDAGGTIRWVSRTDSGYRLDRVLGHPFEAFLDRPEAQAFRDALQNTSDAPRVTEHSVDTPNGRRRFITRSVAAELSEGQSGHLHVVTDITEAVEPDGTIVERWRWDEAVEAQERRTAQILETMHDGYLLIGQDGTIRDANGAYAQMVGRSREELLGTPLSALLVHDDADALRVEGPKRFETQHRRADGEPVDIEVSASRMPFDGADVVILFLRDLTERNEAERQRRELEAQVRHKHRLEALGTLASGVAHEINNPIQGILGFAQLIQGRTASSGDLHDFAGEIIVECGRIARIVSDLLVFARRESDSQTPSEVRHLIVTTLSLLRPALVKDGIDVEVEVPDELPAIACRGDQIRQVLMNLFTNARDALNARYSENDSNKKMAVRAWAVGAAPEEWVRIEVEDCGRGIEPEIAERIFDPFFTTKEPDSGTGLGLAVSQRIVADHGGRLEVDSEPGVRTRFHLDLPVAPAGSAAGAAVENAS